jgi:hypothetical protein
MYRMLDMPCVAILVAGTGSRARWPQEWLSMNYDVSECASATSFALELAW